MPLSRSPIGPGLLAGLLVAATALAGCSHHPAPAAAHGTPPPKVATGDNDENTTVLPPVTVAVRQGPHGAVMTDASGWTVYTFSADADGSPHCKGECANRWRPVVSRAGKPRPGTGTSTTALGSVLRTDGSYQVTFNGLPLYQFIGDTAPGQVNGSGRTEFGGSWSAAPPPAR
jgi:predicted lipoprotein with Yx(FWY)xxD motif